MPLNAFIIRPFGVKDVLLPGQVDVRNGETVRVSKLIRVDFERIHEQLIGPALSNLHMAANTTEVIVEAGNIREDMFNLLMTADLVVADLTIHNPNVFYELGIRHAFRDRFTFLMRSEGNDDPFDLRTDRYFKYSHENPGASIDGLTRALRATISSERSDSPVFRLLPKMRTEDRSRFITVPSDFREAVERAQKHRRCGDLKLLAVECEGFLWEAEGLREVGRAQFQLNFLHGARHTWEEIVRRYPNDVEANMALSTIYQRAGDATRSEQALARISKLEIPDINTVAEIQALVGRNLKSRWMECWYAELQGLLSPASEPELKPAERQQAVDRCRQQALRSPLLRKARQAYAMAFRDNLNYTYAGLNALSLMIIEVSLARDFPAIWTLLADGDDDPEYRLQELCRDIENLTAALDYAISSERKRLTSENRIDFWFESMEAAFLCITSASEEKVAQEYLEAMLWAPERAEESMRPALRMYLDLQTRHPNREVDIPANVRAALALVEKSPEERRSGGNIVVFVGLRLDELPQAGEGDAPVFGSPRVMRFLPASQVQRAQSEIRKVIERELASNGPIQLGMASGANGSDLLFHAVCDEIGIETRLYLALPRDRYVGAYVAQAGAEWIDRFDRIHRARSESDRKLVPGRMACECSVNVLADCDEMPRWLQGKLGYTMGKRNAVWMLQHALALRDLCGSDRSSVTLIALWDRQNMQANGGIGELVRLAEKGGVKVIHIDCSAWSTLPPAEVATLPIRPEPGSRIRKADAVEAGNKPVKDRHACVIDTGT